MTDWLLSLAAGAIAGCLVSVIVSLTVLRLALRRQVRGRTRPVDGAASMMPTPSTLITDKLQLLDGINRRRRGGWR